MSAVGDHRPRSVLESREKALHGSGFTREQMHEALRVSAVVHAAAVTLDAEAAALA
ncbi:hypothetical protein [Micromonospora sp. NBC_01638]|uniref:hypothetical protein n=1 Tax=Micromonospora sp. NBC_01638 TaxID=2975982 RepID=UPI00386C85D8|nr:hypothetical protein OG811_17060 [Micromonospora sp. NBC_01638]